MRVLRRVVFPILWLLIFSLIAAALVKMAFFDGLRDQGEAVVPGGGVQVPVVAAVVGTVTNKVEVTGTVQSDAAVAVRSTAAGKVVYFFVDEGATVNAGDRLFQIRAEVIPDLVEPAPSSDDEKPAAPAAPPAPVYSYNDVLAPASGTLNTLTVLLNQEVSVGDNAGTVAPGTMSITGSLNTAQQFRLLGQPTTATGTVTNGPAPFTCPNVQLSNKEAGTTPDPAPVGMDPIAQGESAGRVSCAVPADVSVFPGLGATITLTAGESQNVLTLPLTAVKGSVQKGLVWIPASDGGASPQEREVVLGLNDGEHVEIVSGLAEGDPVLQFVPGVDAAPQQDGQLPGYGRVGG